MNSDNLVMLEGALSREEEARSSACDAIEEVYRYRDDPKLDAVVCVVIRRDEEDRIVPKVHFNRSEIESIGFMEAAKFILFDEAKEPETP